MTTLTASVPGTALRRRPRPEPEHRTTDRRRVDGSVLDTVTLDPSIFGLEPNVALIHQVVTAQLAAARAGTQSTRTRAEVRGGGTKPFKQKGTGRARQGSIRAPLWSGGGVALGPKPRSYRQRTPKKMIHLAMCSALSDRAIEGRVVVIDEWSFPVPRTKDAVAALAALGLEGRVLVVLGPDDGIPDRSFANLSHVQTMQVGELNAYDVVRSDWVVFTDATVPGQTTVVPGSGPKPAPTATATKAAKATKATRAPKPAKAAKAAAAADAEAGTGSEVTDTPPDDTDATESDATPDAGSETTVDGATGAADRPDDAADDEDGEV
ncbi:MAG: 50S ribosomal protein L4 [Acidimicrobiales bacterium]